MDTSVPTPLRHARGTGLREVGLRLAVGGIPLATALTAGALLTRADGRFDERAAITAGALTAVLCAVLPRSRPRRPRPSVVASASARAIAPPPGRAEPPPEGTTVRVRTHFTAAGGYVADGGLLVWAAPAGDPHTEFTPGTTAVVRGGEPDAPAVAVAVARSGTR